MDNSPQRSERATAVPNAPRRAKRQRVGNNGIEPRSLVLTDATQHPIVAQGLAVQALNIPPAHNLLQAPLAVQALNLPPLPHEVQLEADPENTSDTGTESAPSSPSI